MQIMCKYKKVNRVSISIVLDSRRKKKDGKYPVKLRVYDPSTGKQKLYATGFNFTKEEFSQVWNLKKTKTQFKDYKHQLAALEAKAYNEANKIDPFDFKLFERRVTRSSDRADNVVYHYERIIEIKKNSNSLSTADVYTNSLKMLRLFASDDLKKDFDEYRFSQIDVDFLDRLERFVLNDLGRSVNTLSIYLRALRTVFNTVIEEKEVQLQETPFGKRKYQIPSRSNTKKALSKDELKRLFEAKTETIEQEKAKDFWFFSYACNGMNINDVAKLKYADLDEDKFQFYRGKTLNTSKANLRPVTVYLNDYSRQMITKYGVAKNRPKGLVFAIIQEDDDESKIKSKVKNFTRFVNQHIKLLAQKSEVNELLSSNWARHTFATNAINKGVSMEFMQESLGHKNVKTTQNYFAGFDSETKKKFAQSIMKF